MAPDPKSSNPGPEEPTESHRENVPGELEHASGEVEEFEAELVSGANGRSDDNVSEAELEQAAAEAVGDLDDDGDVDEEDKAIARRGGREPAKAGGGGPRFFVFLKASWAELQRVQWPDRRQVGQATAVVVGFVIVAGAYLGLADWVAQRVVDAIL
jgi:preprotein translocase subunit SecE